MKGQQCRLIRGASVAMALLLAGCGQTLPAADVSTQAQPAARRPLDLPVRPTPPVTADCPVNPDGLGQATVLVQADAASTASAHEVREAQALSRAAVEAARDGDSQRAIELLQLAKAKLVGVNLSQLSTSDRTEVVNLLEQIDRALERSGA